MNPVDVFLPPQEGSSRALVALSRPEGITDVPASALVGTVELDGQGPDWRTFEPMSGILDLYARFMRGGETVKPDILAQARAKPGDYIYVIDGRVSDPAGQVPFHDIIGWYRSDASGRPIADTFEYNADHKMVSSAGFSSLLSEPQVRALAFAPSGSPTRG
jgi:hypothetical protein